MTVSQPLSPDDPIFTLTLGAIRAKSPCESGWKTLLRSLGYENGSFDPNHELSLGDIAASNGASDAYWCFRVLDWSNLNLRRLVIREIVLPTVKRACEKHNLVKSLACLEQLACWCNHDIKIEIQQVRKDAAADAADAAAAAAASAASAAAAYAAAADAAYAAADAAYAAAERQRQKQEILRVFPCKKISKTKAKTRTGWLDYTESTPTEVRRGVSTLRLPQLNDHAIQATTLDSGKVLLVYFERDPTQASSYLVVDHPKGAA